MPAETSAWFPSITRPDSRASVRLICLPFAGGNASTYRAWGAALAPTVEVRPVDLPGRGSRLREAPFRDARLLVEAIADAMEPLLDRPIALFGHSMGAMLAFELARTLRRRGGPAPVHLFVSGHHAPHSASPMPAISALSDDEFERELRRLGGTPPELFANAELLEIVRPMLRADFAVCESYRFESEPPLAIPITACGGLADPDLPRERLEAWREHTTGPFAVRVFPGDHFYLNGARDLLLRVVARQLAA